MWLEDTSTRLIQEALECEGLKSQDVIRSLEEKLGKNQNVPQQKTIICRENDILEEGGQVICIYSFSSDQGGVELLSHMGHRCT